MPVKKHYKKQKSIINGDFNATTSLSLYQSYFDGKTIIEDPLCNYNGMRIKAFCRETRVVMTQTYFDHPVNERYTWFSPNSITKKVLDYILMEPFINKYTIECKVLTEMDIDSDHKMVLAIMKTPLTKQARKQQIKAQNKTKLDLKLLDSVETSQLYIEKVKEYLINNTYQPKNQKITNCLIIPAGTTLKYTPKSKKKEIWKEDYELNTLLDQRRNSNSEHEHKDITRKIKKRVKYIRNQIYEQEAKEINEYASKRDIQDFQNKKLCI